MNTDMEIAQKIPMKHIIEVAKDINLQSNDLIAYGEYKAKIKNEVFEKVKGNQNAKLILVTALTPTKAGEGKTTTTIGLADGLSALAKKVVAVLREPSLGPVFGLKGGATGGGYAQMVPMEDINLHFTGDIHAITSANNLISTVLDNHLFQGNELQIDPHNVVWKRCLDMNDRSLRNIDIGKGNQSDGVQRSDHFQISVASEIMAVLCLAISYQDLKQRIANILVAYTMENQPVYVKDLQIEGAICALLKDAFLPNLVQTLHHTPVLVHGGPFANIAHGCNSIRATKLGLKLANYVVTEAGFGADLGAEKFFDIKSRMHDLHPNAVVMVVTIRALKMHGGVAYDDLHEENVEALIHGCSNLQKHMETIDQFEIPAIIAINQFPSDTIAEIEAVKMWCAKYKYQVLLSEAWAKGAKGTLDLAQAVIELCEQKEPKIHYAYQLEDSIETKVQKVATRCYGVNDVIFSEKACIKIAKFKQFGWDTLPICIAKTPNSLSDQPKQLGRPKPFTLHVEDINVSLGAGFIVVYTGTILTMPGLPKHPAAMDIDIDNTGDITGLF